MNKTKRKRNLLWYLRWSILTCSLILAFVGCRKDPAIPNLKDSYFHNKNYGYTSDSIVTILTYNIHCAFESALDPWNPNATGATEKHIQDLVTVLRTCRPDIILLQEVPRNRCNNEIKEVLEAVADSLRMNYAFGAHGGNDACKPYNGLWGNAILSKYEINNMENLMVLFIDKWRTRSVMRCEIRVNDSLNINVFNLHYDGKDEEEIPNTVNFIKQSKLPLVIGGDFNRRYGNSELAQFKLDDYFSNIITGIDRIYGNLNAQPQQMSIIPRSNIVSDHGAFFVNLTLR